MQNKPVLVIGGGMSGITAAVEIAEVGKEVILIEKKPYLGGNVVRFNNYFPKMCPPKCGLEINFRRIRQNPGIKTLTSTELVSISGTKGDFRVQLKTAPQYVKNNCTACGKCIEVCPVDRIDEYNYNFSKTRAIYLPHAMAFPYKYSIDDEYCEKSNCGKCLDVCEYEAIDLDAKETVSELDIHSIVWATGWENYDASKIENLNYSSFQDVITNVELERLLAEDGPDPEFGRPSDKQKPNTIVFVQCAGSRDENHLPYCSAVCCSASLKHALTIQEMYPDTKIKIFYIDMRVSGRNEDFLEKVKAKENIELIKGKVAKVELNNSNLTVEAEDILSNSKVKQGADLVVLATGIVPSGNIMNLRMDNNGFISSVQDDGQYVAGCCKKPMDVSASVKDATSAALKAIQ